MLEVVWSQYMVARANMYISKCSQSNSKVLASFLSVGRNRDFDYLFDQKCHLVSVGLYDLVLERRAVLAVKSYNAVRLSGPVVWFPETYQLLDR